LKRYKIAPQFLWNANRKPYPNNKLSDANTPIVFRSNNGSTWLSFWDMSTG